MNNKTILSKNAKEVLAINEAMKEMKSGEELFQFINLLLKQKEREVSAKER